MALLCGAALTLASAHAAPTVIDFETNVSGPTYTEAGVTFSNNDPSLGLVNENLSGSGQGLRPNPAGNPMRADFSGLFSGTISVRLGDSGSDEDAMFLRVFDTAGTLIAEDTDILPGGVSGFRVLEVTANNIAFAVLGGIGSGGVSSVIADKFTLAPVPVPAAAILFPMGVLLLRRRKKTVSS